MAVPPSYPWHAFDYRKKHYLVDGGSGAVHVLDEAAAASWEYLSAAAGGSATPDTPSLASSVPGDLVARFGPQLAAEAWQEVVSLVLARGRGAHADKADANATAAASTTTMAATATMPAVTGSVDSLTRSTPVTSGGLAEPIRIGTPLKALCLLVAMDCNLACRYCFAAPDWQRHGARRMPAETARRAIDFLIEASGPSRFLQIDFFGGEPSLNFAVVRNATEYAYEQCQKRGKAVNFTFTTNALIWNDEIADLLNEYHFQLILSLDGRPQVHDRLRRRVGDQPSQAQVLEHVHQAVEALKDKNYWIRGTFTHCNLDFANDVQYLYEQGFRHISLEPVVDGPQYPWSLRDEDLPQILAEYERLADFYLRQAEKGDPFEFFHFRIAPPTGPCVARRISGCGAGYQYLAVTPEGDLYPCHQFVGREGMRMGSIFDPDAAQRFGPRSPSTAGGCSGTGASTVSNANPLAERFRRTHALAKAECRQCWAKLYCGGGCTANAHQLTGGDLQATLPFFCALQKKRTELAIALRAELQSRMHTSA
ncbi:MAG: SPASM domain-containing protein [Limnochordaceae bacterium]|nr:SPASM domain-containing protein [Limnochordaceae bacterium]